MTARHIKDFEGMLLRSLRLFWPVEHLRLLVVLDGESEEDRLLEWELEKLAQQLNLPPFKVFYEEPSTVYKSGHDRQQWSMFWADNYTTSVYVGFLDTDTVFTTRVHAGDLFEFNRPLVHGVVGRPENSFWDLVGMNTAGVLGRPEVMRGMNYFPVIMKVSHLAHLRHEVTKRLRTVNFDEAFRLFTSGSFAGGGVFSQFNIMANFVFVHHHCQYSFALEEMRPGDRLHGEGQTTCLDTILDALNTFPRVKVAVHYNYIQNRKDVDDYLREGLCRSLGEQRLDVWEDVSQTCRGYNDTTIQETLFTFEFHSWTWNVMCRKAQLAHYKAVRQLRSHWDSNLVKELFAGLSAI
jgi:hypothetical protein